MEEFFKNLYENHLTKILTGINLILGAIIAFLSTKGLIHLGRLTKNGRTVCLLFLSTIIISVYQNIYNDDQIKVKEELLRTQFISDLKEATSKSEKNLMETAAKYALRYDASQKSLERIVRDSSKTRVIQTNNPILQICKIKNIAAQDNFNEYVISFCSKGAGSSNLNVGLYLVLGDTSNFTPQKYIDKFYLSKNNPIPESRYFDKKFKLTGGFRNYNAIFIWVIGTYTSVGGTQPLKIDQLYYHNFKSEELSVLDEEPREQIIQFIKNRSSL